MKTEKDKRQFLFISGNVPEFVFTLEKTKKSVFNVQKFETCRQCILKVIRGFHTVRTVIYVAYTGPVIGVSLYAIVEFE